MLDLVPSRSKLVEASTWANDINFGLWCKQVTTIFTSEYLDDHHDYGG